MNVETYEIEEKVDSPTGTCPEMEAEAVRIVEELGLTGQQSLLVQDEDTGQVNRIPYPKMSSQERVVYGYLFSQHDNIFKYSAGIIPVRILQVIGHSKSLFDSLEIWHDCVVNPDPVLVGMKGNDVHLLARWGKDALKQFKDLMVEARGKFTEEWTMRAKQRIADCQIWLASMESHVEAKIAGEWIYEPF